MSLESPLIFIDESGDAGLKPAAIEKCRYFVLGFVYAPFPGKLRKTLTRLLKRIHQRNYYPPKLHELKFSLPKTDLFEWGYTETEVRRYEERQLANRPKMLQAITSSETKVYAAICDKTQANPTWTPERFGNYIFAQTLVTNILPGIKETNTPHIIYDKGRLSSAKSTNFKSYLLDKDRFFESHGIRRYPDRLGAPIDVSSMTEPGLWASDIVAGAYRHDYTTGDPVYRNTLAKNYLERGYRFFWREK